MNVTIKSNRQAGMRHGGDHVFDLDAFIPYRLNRAAEQISQRFAKVYRKAYGITRPEWRTLANLGQHGRLTARQICDLSSQHKTKVSRAVAALEARKWLRRESNPADRREEWLELTREGVAVFRDLSRLGLEQDRTLVEALGKEDAAALARALAALERLALDQPDGVRKRPSRY